MKTVPLLRDRETALAAETAKSAKQLPEGAAIRIAVSIASKEKHLADLLFGFVSRGQEYCNRFVTISQAANIGSIRS